MANEVVEGREDAVHGRRHDHQQHVDRGRHHDDGRHPVSFKLKIVMGFMVLELCGIWLARHE